MKGEKMGTLKVELDNSTDKWQVRDGKKTIATFPRLQDARARAREELLARGKGSVVVFTPSGRPREKFNVTRTPTGSMVHAA